MIEQTTNINQWNHVPGRENPADVASRGCKAKILLKHPLWKHGPEWLTTGNYPTNKPLESAVELHFMTPATKLNTADCLFFSQKQKMENLCQDHGLGTTIANQSQKRSRRNEVHGAENSASEGKISQGPQVLWTKPQAARTFES
jgi:hypothetical protein